LYTATARCTYAHTLCGHEYFANEDFEKAMACYRAALRLDSRHYNAWYGLGTVYYRQGCTHSRGGVRLILSVVNLLCSSERGK
jgi:cytochrome c-type biogenesis protein CcmH/NrfG